jgi:hypothetical protein
VVVRVVLFQLLGGVLAFGFFLLAFWIAGWFGFDDPEGWWRRVFAQPIRERLAAADAAWGGGTALLAAGVGVVVLAKAIMFVPMALLELISRSFMETQSDRMLRDVRERLRSLFSEDTERIAVYEARLGKSSGGGSFRSLQLLGCGGCLFSIVWVAVSSPVQFGVRMGVCDSIRRIFLPADGTPRSDVLGFGADERTWQLALAVGAVTLLRWVIKNVSPSGHTLPAGLPRIVWVSFAVSIAVCWLTLPSVFLVVMLFTAAVDTVLFLVGFVARRAYLSLRGTWAAKRRAAALPTPVA